MPTFLYHCFVHSSSITYLKIKGLGANRKSTEKQAECLLRRECLKSEAPSQLRVQNEQRLLSKLTQLLETKRPLRTWWIISPIKTSGSSPRSKLRPPVCQEDALSTGPLLVQGSPQVGPHTQKWLFILSHSMIMVENDHYNMLIVWSYYNQHGSSHGQSMSLCTEGCHGRHLGFQCRIYRFSYYDHAIFIL